MGFVFFWGFFLGEGLVFCFVSFFCRFAFFILIVNIYCLIGKVKILLKVISVIPIVQL